ncbi:hypothetical protein FOA52_004337 [Chlamydomonas sp. UWO 241]|nr:hypothetical protein FOA52_004337 [Chlamydomonas sp. UWO 241]
MHERRVVLGHHPLEVDAAKAYDVAAYYLLRDDARLNFKNEVPDSPAPELLARLQGTFSHGVRGKSGKGKQANTTSKYKGVFQRTGDDGWLVQVRHGGKTIPLGRLEGEDDAARLYDCAAYHLWQDSARLNFPNETPQPLESKWVEKLEAAATAASTADCLIELATRGGPSCGGGGEAEGEAKQHKKSLYRGVWWDASLERWELRIMVAEGKSKYLGQYETEEGAARAYDSVLFKLRGASAKLNFPDETPELPSGDLAARLAGSGKEGAPLGRSHAEGGSGGGGSDTKTDDEADPATGAGGAGEAQAGGHNGDDAGAEAGPSYVAGTAAAAAAADHGGDEAGPSGGAAAAEEGAAEAGTSGGAARGGGRKRAGAGGGGAAGGGGRKRAGAGAGGAEGGGAAKKGRMSAANKAIAAAAAAAAAAVAASDAAFEDLQSPPAAPASAAGGNEQGAAAGGRRATRGSLALLAQLAEAM